MTKTGQEAVRLHLAASGAWKPEAPPWRQDGEHADQWNGVSWQLS